MKINHAYIKYQIKFLKNNYSISLKINTIKRTSISPHFAFAQIYKLQGYGQYKMHGSVINVPANVDQTQSILSHLPHDGVTIYVLFK